VRSWRIALNRYLASNRFVKRENQTSAKRLVAEMIVKMLMLGGLGTNCFVVWSERRKKRL
jgi:hypothetical protein